MADNIFSTLTADEGNIFTSITDETAPASTLPTQNKEGQERTARMAAIADTDMSGDDIGLSAQYRDLIKSYNDQIASVGDSQIRREQAAAQQNQEVKALSSLGSEVASFDVDGSLQRSVVAAARTVYAEDIERRQEYALEQRAIENIQNLAARGDSTQAKLLLNNLEHGTVNDVVRDTQTKQQVLQREIERAGIEKKDQSWFFDATDFLMSAIPFNISAGQVGNIDVEKGLTHWYDNILAGQRVQREAETLWNMPAADFAKYVREHLIPNVKENTTLLGYHSRGEELDVLSSMQRAPEAWVTNSFNAIDNVGVLAPFVKPARAAASIPLMLAKNGARKEAAQAIAEAVEIITKEGVEAAAEKTGINMADVVDNTLASAVNPNPQMRVPMTGDTLLAIERGEEMIRQMPELIETARLHPDELAAAYDATVKRIETEVNRTIKDVTAVERKLVDGSSVHEVQITLGKAHGGGFLNEAQAKKSAKALGYAGAESIQDESGQWFFKVNEPVIETGFFTNTLNVQASTFLERRVLSSRLVQDKMIADAAQVGGNRRQKFFTGVIQDLTNRVSRNLNNEGRERLGQFLAASRNSEKWFNDDELQVLSNRAYGRSLSDKELDAYHAAIDINDIEYTYRNQEAYKSKFTRGYKTVSFNTGIADVPRRNALIDRNFTNTPKGETYDVAAGQYFDELTPAQLEKYKAEGYVIVRTENPVQMGDQKDVRNFLVKQGDVQIEDLRPDQLAYTAGGHRMYEGKYFAKQASLNAEGKVVNPNTFIVGQTKKEIDDWTAVMERARLAHKDGGAGEAELDEIFGGNPGFPSGREYLDGIASGKYQKNRPFLTLYDREMPEEYVTGNYDLSLVDEAEEGYESYLRTNGRMYYSSKGDQLRDFQGALAPTLDPYETINASLRNIANLSSFSDYKINLIERWDSTFGKYLDNKATASSYARFNNPIWKQGTPQRIKESAIAQQEIGKRTLGWKTEADLRADQMTRSAREWVEGVPAARNAVDWVLDSNPVSKLKGMVFDAKLGLFNFVQFPLQVSTLAASTALAGPVRGMQALSYIVPLRAALTKGGTDNVLDYMSKKGFAKMVGLPEQEFKDSLRLAKNSGFFDVDAGTHQLIDDYGSHAGLDGFANGVDAVRQKGRFAFYEAERWNRAGAWHIAWQETREKFPALDYKGAEFQQKLAGRAEEYAFSMSEQSGAWWQKGVMSIPTQFWAYNVRMLEALTSGTFSPAQKARLLMFQGGLYGSAGVPGIAAISELYEQKTGKAFKPDTFLGSIDRGLIDTLIYHTTGIDALVSERYGTGNWSADLIREMMGASPYGEKSLAEFAGGATLGVTGQVLGQTGKTLGDIYKYTVAESGGDTGRQIIAEDVLGLARQVSTLSNLDKARLVAQYGTYVSNTGTTTVSGLPSVSAFAVALSVAPGEVDSVSARMAYTKDRGERVKAAAKVIENYRTRMVNEPDNRDKYAAEINLYVKLLPPDIKVKALKQAHKDTDPSLWSSLEEQMKQEDAQRELQEQLQK